MRMYVRMAGSHESFRSQGQLAVFVESPRLLHLELLLHGERLAPARPQSSACQSGNYAGGRRGLRATHAVACCISSLAIHSWYRGTCHRRYGRRTIRSAASVVASFNRIACV